MNFGSERPSHEFRPIDVDRSHDPSTEIGGSGYTPSVPPTAVDATEQHHRSRVWAALILVAGAAVLMTPILVGSPRGLDQRPTRPGVLQPSSKLLVAPSRAAGDSDRPKSEVDTPVFEQFIQLDEVLITSTGDNVDVPENMPAAKVFDGSERCRNGGSERL